MTHYLKVISTTVGVIVLYSLVLMAGTWASIPPFFLGENERFTYGVLGTVIALVIIYGVLKIDRKSWRDYYLTVDKQTLVRFGKGTIFAIIVGSAMILSQVGFSGLEITLLDADLSRFALMSLSLIPLAFMEELVFRSYPLVNLNEAFGVWVAQLVIAVLFALYHYAGGWSLLMSFAGPGVWSLAYGLLALRSKGIALPTGFHFGLNFILATIGDKHWVPGLVSIDFATTPTEEMLQANAYFGVGIQLVLFVTLLALTYRYTKQIHETKQSHQSA